MVYVPWLPKRKTALLSTHGEIEKGKEMECKEFKDRNMEECIFMTG